MSLPCGIRHSIERGMRAQHNIHKGLVRALVPLSPRSIVRPAALRTQHNVSADSVIRCRIVEPATPCAVVAPAGGGDALTAPPLNPALLVGLRHPRPLEAAGGGDHDIAHGAGVYTPWGSGGRIRLIPGSLSQRVPPASGSGGIVLTDSRAQVCTSECQR
jgi:hypothetical protein